MDQQKTATLAIYDGENSHEIVIPIDDLGFDTVDKAIDHIKYLLLTELNIVKEK